MNPTIGVISDSKMEPWPKNLLDNDYPFKATTSRYMCKRVELIWDEQMDGQKEEW